MSGSDSSSGATHSKNSDSDDNTNNNGYQGPEDMTTESMYAGLVSIFVVAVVLFIGISISLAGSSKCCRKRCKCCRRGRRDVDEEEGQNNAAFTDSPPTYDEVMRRDRTIVANPSVPPTDIFTITAPSMIDSRSSSGSSGGSTTVLCAPPVSDNITSGNRSRSGSPPLARQGNRRSLRAMLGNPPNYFEVLRNWTSNKIFTTAAPSENWKSSTPPPKYSDVEKQMEEERQRSRNSNTDNGNNENGNGNENGNDTNGNSGGNGNDTNDSNSNDEHDSPA